VRRDRDGHGASDGLGLLARQGRRRAPGLDGLGVDSGAGSGVEAAQHEPGPGTVEDGEREAQRAAGVLEGVVADEPHPAQRGLEVSFERGGPLVEAIDIPNDSPDAFEVLAEDGLEAAAFFTLRQALEPARKPPESPGLEDHQGQQQEQGNADGGNDRPEMGLRVGVQIDRGWPPGAPRRGGCDRV
jgi:hypothetical protein